MFDRYNITSTDDLHEAARRQNEYVEHAIVKRQSKIEGFDEQNADLKKPVIH